MVYGQYDKLKDNFEFLICIKYFLLNFTQYNLQIQHNDIEVLVSDAISRGLAMSQDATKLNEEKPINKNDQFIICYRVDKNHTRR